MKSSIRSIRKGSVQWNEDDRLDLVRLLAKCGYAVQITRRNVSGMKNRKNGQMEYIVEFWEEADDAVYDDRLG